MYKGNNNDDPDPIQHGERQNFEISVSVKTRGVSNQRFQEVF